MRGLLVLAMLAACGGPMAEDAESDDLFGPIAVQPLDVPGAAAVGLTAVRTAKDWQALAGKGAASPVDFRKEMALVLNAGSQPQGTRAHIDAASYDAGTLTVATTLQIPGSSCAARAPVIVRLRVPRPRAPWERRSELRAVCRRAPRWS